MSDPLIPTSRLVYLQRTDERPPPPATKLLLHSVHGILTAGVFRDTGFYDGWGRLPTMPAPGDPDPMAVIAEMRELLISYLHLLEDLPLCSMLAAEHVRRLRAVLSVPL